MEMIIYPKLKEHAVIAEFANKAYESELSVYYEKLIDLYKVNELKLKHYEFTKKDVIIRIDNALSKNVNRKPLSKKTN